MATRSPQPRGRQASATPGGSSPLAASQAAYLAKSQQEKHAARDAATNQFKERFGTIFQRRHDSIHNCDRRWISQQPLETGGTVLKVIQDVEILVNRCAEHINSELGDFLVGTGSSAATTAQAGY